MLETLSVNFLCYFVGNVRNLMLPANAATLRGLTYFILWLKYLEILVYKFLLVGGGVYSQRKALRITFYMFVLYGATMFNI